MLAITARALYTRLRRSLSLRSSCQSSSSRQSSGMPLVMSRRPKWRTGVAISSASSSEGEATLASTRVREPSCGRRTVSRVGTAIGARRGAGRDGGAGFGAFGSSQTAVVR